MKKIFFLCFLFTLPTGSVNVTAQVTIGSDHAPRAGAGLDLDSDKGLLLPKVPLSGSATDFQLDGDPASAKGMMLYNIGSGLNGPGIYVWDGQRWNLAMCSPATPSGITFSKRADIALNERITATAIPEVTSGTSIPAKYNWTIPGDYFDIVGEKNVREITLQARAATAETITGTIKVNAENGCGKSEDYANITELNILDCSAAPATPTLTITATTINKNGTVSLSCTDVGNGTTTYAWTFPASLSGTSTTRTVTVTGATAGTYAANTISVKATNACGSTTATGSGGAITVRDCSAAPATPGTITFTPTTVNLNGTFTASVPAVTTGTQIPTSYTWTLPTGLTIASGSGTRSITIKGAAVSTYAAGTIKVTATNACGTSAARSSASAVTVTGVGAGPTVTGSRSTYRTYCYPNNIGCWTIDNSKEGTYNETTYEGQSAGARGYYYTWANATLKSGSQYTACPTGFSVPTETQWTKLMEYIVGSATSSEKANWMSMDVCAGFYLINWTMWSRWSVQGAYWSGSANDQYFIVNKDGPLFRGPFEDGDGDYQSVRCVKN